MPRLISIAPLTAISLLLSSASAFADVTADEVWADMKELMESYGQTVTVGGENRSGDSLVVSDIVINLELPDGSTSASLDEINFVERGDGTVEIVISPEYRIVSSAKPEAGEAVEMRMVMTHSGLSIVVGGDETVKNYDFEADTIAINMTEMAVEGEAVPVTVTLSAEAASGGYDLTKQDNGRAFQSTLDADRMTIAAQGSEPGTTDTFLFDVDISNVASTSDGFLPAEMNMEDFSATLRAGMSFAGEMTYEGSAAKFEADADGSQTAGEGGTGAGSLSFAMNADTLSYATTSTDIKFAIRSSDIPLPNLSMAMAESAFQFAMPVMASDTPQDFGIVTAMRGLTVSDSIWALFDPMGSLPRDPATVAVDVTGKAKWLIDILNPEAAAEMAGPPGEVSELTLDDLEVSVAGAELTGSGAFTFDNTDLVTFEGMPAPDGAVDLQLVGGNGLLDRLVGMGLIPEDQAMGVRMMLGLFARPGDGEDTLVSKIEVKPNGEVIANGQRLK